MASWSTSAEDEDGARQYGARAAQPKSTGHTGTLQGSGERPAPPVLALRLQQEDKGDTQVRGHRPQGHRPRPQTREDVARPLYEVASTHTARKTFIGNLYRQVKDPNLIASMSGHSEGSRAFARYRKIDDEMKKELVNLLD